MKSVGLPTRLLRFRSRESSDNSIAKIQELTPHPVNIAFPLEIASNNHSVIQDEDEHYLMLPQLVKEKWKLYLKLLQLASSTSKPKLDIFNDEITPDLVNRLDKSQGASPLHYASMNGNLEMATFLLEKGANVNLWDYQRETTPLICAAAHGHLGVVEVLLDHDGDVNASSENGSALLWAVRGNHPEVVRCLLDRNAIQISNIAYSETPIHAAVISGSPDILEILINAQNSHISKADFQMGIQKDTPLHLAASGKFQNSLDLCKILIDQAQVHVNSLNASEKTPLHVAAASNASDIVKLLLSRWANVNAVDIDGRTPLFFLMSDTDEALKCLDVLVKWGKCDVNLQDKRGYTALHFAAIHEAEGAAKMLLMNMADFSIKANGGISALSILRRKVPDMEVLLREVFDQAVTVTKFDESTTKTRREYSVDVDFKYVLPATPSTSSRDPEKRYITEKCRHLSQRKSIFKDTKEDMSTRRKETSKIKCLIEEEQANLLLHPVIHAFLELKWQNARPLFSGQA